MNKLLNKNKKLILFTGLKMMNAIIGLFINMFIVRKITVGDFGVYSIILTILGFLTTFGFSWSGATIIFFGAKEKAESGSLNKTFWSRNYILIGSLSLVLFTFMVFGKKIEEYIGVKLNQLLIIWLFIKIGLDILNTYFLAIKDQLSSALIIVIGKIMFLLSVIFLNYSLKQLIILNILCEFTGLVYVFKMNKEDIGKPVFEIENFKKVLNFGLWQLFGFSGIYLINFGDNFIIKYFLTIEDVGIYNVGYKLFHSIAGLSLIFSSYYAPIVIEAIDKENKSKLKQIFYRERFLLILIILIPHLMVIFFSKTLLLLIYGENYIEANTVLQVLMIGSFIKFSTTFNRLVYNSTGNHKQLQLWNILQMIINIILDIILVRSFGILGAAIGTTVAILITSIFNTLKSEKILKEMVV